MNNAVFDKTMENVRNARMHVDVRHVTRWDRKYDAKASRNQTFIVEAFFPRFLVAIEMRKLEMKFDKPIYVGISSIYPRHVYMIFTTNTWHHCFENYKIMYTDMDNLIYYIESTTTMSTIL